MSIASNKAPGNNVIIIGGGISGLSTGIYLSMNGFKTTIYEKHLLPGGCCTAWSRQGYIFDYCIDWLIGSGPGNDAHRVWQELGALDGKKVKNFPIFNRVVDEHGAEVLFFNDPKKLEKHLLTQAPEDQKLIKRFCRDLARFIDLEIYPPFKPNALMSFSERLQEIKKALPAIGLFMRTAGVPMKAFADRFKNPLLKRAMNYIFFQDPQTFPLLPYLYNMACAHKCNAGFPEGGSLGLSCSMEQRYLALGGTIHYGAQTKKILIDNDRAVGIELKKGPSQFADLVIAACDGATVIYDFLDGKYTNKTIDKLYNDILKRPGVLFPSVVSIFFGIKGEVSLTEPHSTTYLLDKERAKDLPGCMQNCLVLQHRSHYAAGFAPPGNSVIHCTYFSDFDFWHDLRASDKKIYRAHKQQIIDFTKSFLIKRYPHIKDRIEVAEVATPATTKRYTGNYKGSIFGWKAFSKADDLSEHLVNKLRMGLPGLKGFYMTGQWVLGGGLPRAAMSGRYVAQYVCQAAGKPFVVKDCVKVPWSNERLGALPQLDLDYA